MASVTKRPSTAPGGIPAAANPSLSPSSDAPGARRGLLGLVRGLLFDHAFFPLFFVLVMLGELVLGVAIIQRVACQWLSGFVCLCSSCATVPFWPTVLALIASSPSFVCFALVWCWLLYFSSAPFFLSPRRH
jgi:hypothetical protein